MQQMLTRLLMAVALMTLVISLGAVAMGKAGSGAPPAALQNKAVLACADCHSMERAVKSWLEGPHGNLTCLHCHREGDPGWIRHEFLDRNEDMAAHKGAVLTIKLKYDTARCTDCHDPQLAMLRQDLIPPLVTPGAKSARTGQPMATLALHDKHLSAGMDCVACHLPAAHGPNRSTAAYRDLIHNTCQDCHDQKQVRIPVSGSVSCAACHVDPASVAPADHKSAVWTRSHGKASPGGDCGACHLAASAGPHTKLSNPSSFPSQQGDACLACHAGVTMPHDKSFAASHGKAALAVRSGTCESCHSPAQNAVTPLPRHATAQFCADCHLLTMPHPAGFLAAHGKLGLSQPQTCEACHSFKNPVNAVAPHATKQFCATCHAGYQHPQGWVATHGSKVGESCAVCHSVKGDQATHNSCAACHTSSGSWHEKMWFVKHGRVVATQGEASCLRCHSEVQPSCAQCHSSR